MSGSPVQPGLGVVACGGISLAADEARRPGHDPPEYSGEIGQYPWCQHPNWQSDARGYGFRTATLPAEDYADYANIDKEELNIHP
mgnify:CR=1 FL=1